MTKIGQLKPVIVNKIGVNAFLVPIFGYDLFHLFHDGWTFLYFPLHFSCDFDVLFKWLLYMYVYYVSRSICCFISYLYMLVEVWAQFLIYPTYLSGFIRFKFCAYLRGHNSVYFAHRLQCTVTLNSNFAILKTWNCFQLE